MRTLSQIINEEGINFAARECFANPTRKYAGEDFKHWSIRLRIPLKLGTNSTYQSKNHDHDEFCFWHSSNLNDAPYLEHLIEGLIYDSTFAEWDFENFCMECRCSTDSISALKNYENICETTKQFKEFLGDKLFREIYDTVMEVSK